MNKFTAAIVPLIVGFSGCVASLAKIEPEDPQLKTIRMNTGALADDGLYKSAFEKGADKACEGRPYQILERTRTPSTLRNSGVEVQSSTDFFWVVRCER